MIVSEEPKEEEGEIEGLEEDTEERKMEVSLNASSIVRLNTSKTMKFTILVKGKSVIILLNSRATYNFISKMLAEELKLPISLACFVITLRDERKIHRKGHYD